MVTLDQAGRLLYGELYKGELARALGVSKRQVQRWAAGEAVPEDKREAVSRLLAERRKSLEEVLR